MSRASRSTVLAAAGALLVTATGCTSGGGDQRALEVGNHDRTVMNQDHERTYRVFVPDDVATGDPLPLVLVMHGLGQTGKLLQPATGYDQAALEHRFLVAYPDAVSRMWNTRLPAGAESSLPDDVEFLTAVVDDIARTYPVDRRRVYATGHSAGAQMAYRLACERAAVFAAIAPVAGGMTQPCRPARPVPVLQVVGQEDRIAGEEAAGAVQTLVRLYGCSSAARDKPVGAATVRRYIDCDSDVEVVYAVVAGAGHHVWPTETEGFDTTMQSWKFLSRFRLAASSGHDAATTSTGERQYFRDVTTT